MHIKRVAGHDDPVANLRNARHAVDSLGDAPGGCLQQSVIFAVELDLDGLGHGSQIADQVFHQLGGINFDAGDLVGDLTADLVHDGFDVPPRRRF